MGVGIPISGGQLQPRGNDRLYQAVKELCGLWIHPVDKKRYVRAVNRLRDLSGKGED